MKRILAIGAVAALALSGAAVGAQAGQSKSDVCHYDKDAGTYHLINVADPALDAHFDHGDGEIDGPVPGLPGKVFDATCQIVDEPVVGEPVARAWFDTDGDNTYNEGDVLIAEALVLPDGSYIVNADRFPKKPADDSTFGDFANKSTALPSTAGTVGTGQFTLQDGFFLWRWSTNSVLEDYTEIVESNTVTALTQYRDIQTAGRTDSTRTTLLSPSLPTTASTINITGASVGDDNFLQVEVFVTPTL